MEMIRRDEVLTLANRGVRSEQLLSPENSRSTRVTVTRVTVSPGGHAGRGTRMRTPSRFGWRCAGMPGSCWKGPQWRHSARATSSRFSAGDVHGLENSGAGDFVYLAVTSPPINFRPAYAAEVTGSR